MSIQVSWRTQKDETHSVSSHKSARKALETGVVAGDGPLKLGAGNIVALNPGDRIHCIEGRVWISLKGGRELALGAGNWTQVPADARDIWLSALGESSIRLVPTERELPVQNRVYLAAFIR